MYTNRILRLVFIALLCLFSLTRIYAQDMMRMESGNLTIIYPDRIVDTARRIAVLHGDLITDLESRLGLSGNFKTEIMLLQDPKKFSELAPSDLTVAIAVPFHNIIIIDYIRIVRDRIPLDETLRHELTHLILHRHIRPENLPRWLDEGTAQWISGGIGELLNPPDPSILKRAVRSGRVYRFSDLESEFPSEHDGTLLAYIQSKSFVEFIISRYGADEFRGMLALLREGSSPDEAFIETYEASSEEIEQIWLTSLNRRSDIFSLAAEKSQGILFLLIALLVVAAFIKKILSRSGRDEPDALS